MFFLNKKRLVDKKYQISKFVNKKLQDLLFTNLLKEPKRSAAT